MKYFDGPSCNHSCEWLRLLYVVLTQLQPSFLPRRSVTNLLKLKFFFKPTASFNRFSYYLCHALFRSEIRRNLSLYCCCNNILPPQQSASLIWRIIDLRVQGWKLSCLVLSWGKNVLNSKNRKDCSYVTLPMARRRFSNWKTRFSGQYFMLVLWGHVLSRHRISERRKQQLCCKANHFFSLGPKNDGRASSTFLDKRTSIYQFASRYLCLCLSISQGDGDEECCYNLTALPGWGYGHHFKRVISHSFSNSASDLTVNVQEFSWSYAVKFFYWRIAKRGEHFLYVECLENVLD